MEGSKHLILLLKIPKGKRKTFFEIYRKFGHAPSETFSCPGVGYDSLDTQTRQLHTVSGGGTQ